MTRSMLLARCTAAGVLALALETAGFWWTTGVTPAPAVVVGHLMVLLGVALVVGGWAAAGTSERVAARIWLLGLPCVSLSAILSRLAGAWAVWSVAALVVLLALGRPLRQRESVLVGGVAGTLLGTRLGFFTLREYDGLETAWQPLLTFTVLAIVAISAYLSVPRWFSRPVVSNWGRVCLLLVVTGAATISVVAVGQRGDLRELAAGPPSRTHPPVVLIVLDTLRADHLSLYSYPRNTMPRLTKFAQEQAVVVERAITNAPDSLSAHASLFTGLFPVNHRAHRPFLDDPAPPRFGYGLDPRVLTIAERLSGTGYLTLGVSGNFGPVSRESGLGLDRGFEIYRSHPEVACQFARRSPWRLLARAVNRAGAITWLSACRVRYRTADAITDDAITVVDRAGQSGFLLFVNYMDAHGPYAPPEAFLRQVSDGTPADPVIRYDGELLFLDTHLSRLIERLQQHPSWDEMLLVITSDHGEAFGEHDLVGHSSSLYDVMIRVPLILKLPRDTGLQDVPAVGTRWSRSMQLVDIAPVVLAHAGVDGDVNLDGRGLDGEPSSPRAWSYPSMVLREADDRYRRELRSIEEGRWKLIEDDRGTVELYDLQSDPGEETNLASRHRPRVKAMRAELGPRRPQAPRDRAPVELSEESLERLRSLGYVR